MLRAGRVSQSFRRTQSDDLRVHATGRDFEDADRPEPRRKMMREDGAARVHKQHAIAELQAFDVRIAADENVDVFATQSGVENLLDRSGFRPQFVSHADAPAVNVEELGRAHPGILKEVVVPLGDEHRSKLFAPIEDRRGGHITAVQDEVHASQCVPYLRAEFIKAARERREVGISDQSYAHHANASDDALPAQAGMWALHRAFRLSVLVISC